MDRNLRLETAVEVTNSLKIISDYSTSSAGCGNRIPSMPTGLLRRYIECAAERVLSEWSDIPVHDCGKILQLVQASCIDDIMKNEISLEACSEKYTDDAEKNAIDIEEETSLKEEEKVCHSDEDNSEENSVDSHCEAEEVHAPSLRLDVPELVVYCARGVLCRLCWLPFKGRDSLKHLIAHTKERHSEKASPRFLHKLRKDNSYVKLLGDGLMYCTCSTCIRVGIGRLGTRYDMAPVMPVKVKPAKHAMTQKYLFDRKKVLKCGQNSVNHVI